MRDDLHLFVRRLQDIPFTIKDDVTKMLQEKGWAEDKIASPDPTLLERLVRKRD